MKLIYSDRRIILYKTAQYAKESTAREIYLQIAVWRIIGCVNSIWFSSPSLVNILLKPRRAAVYEYIILAALFLPLAPFSNLFYDKISIRSNLSYKILILAGSFFFSLTLPGTFQSESV